MNDSPQATVPSGFKPVRAGGGFMAFNGPPYLFHEGDAVKMGFHVEARHCNPMGNCHGGMLAAFADMLQRRLQDRAAIWRRAARFACEGLRGWEAGSIAITPARHPKTCPLVVANARHSPGYGCALRPDWSGFEATLGHARKTLSVLKGAVGPAAQWPA